MQYQQAGPNAPQMYPQAYPYGTPAPGWHMSQGYSPYVPTGMAAPPGGRLSISGHGWQIPSPFELLPQDASYGDMDRAALVLLRQEHEYG